MNCSYPKAVGQSNSPHMAHVLVLNAHFGKCNDATLHRNLHCPKRGSRPSCVALAFRAVPIRVPLRWLQCRMLNLMPLLHLRLIHKKLLLGSPTSHFSMAPHKGLFQRCQRQRLRRPPRLIGAPQWSPVGRSRCLMTRWNSLLLHVCTAQAASCKTHSLQTSSHHLPGHHAGEATWPLALPQTPHSQSLTTWPQTQLVP